MKDILVQPWWQYEHDITKYSEKAVDGVEDAMKQSFKEVDSRTLTPQQLQHYKIGDHRFTERPSNNGRKEIKYRFCGKGFSQYINDTDIQTFAVTPSSMAMRLLLTIAILKNFTVYTTDVAVETQWI
eukprot:964526-Amphidinium_carterae.2